MGGGNSREKGREAIDLSTEAKSRLGDKVDSVIGLRSTFFYDIGLPMVNVLETTLEWT